MKYLKRRNLAKKNRPKNYLGLESKYDKLLQQGKKLFLGVSLGRSGMRWCSHIFSMHKNAIGLCERHSIIESFYRYIKWNKLEIDVQGIINIIKDSVVQDWKKYDISFVNSPYLSHDLLYLYKVLKPEYIVWFVNDPKFTVISFYNKGWYEEEIVRSNDSLVYGVQPKLFWNQIFGRIVPRDKEYQKWKYLTKIGKISWLYNAVNLEIYNNISQIPKEKVFIFKLEDADQNYEHYLGYARKFGLKEILSKKKFLSIKKLSVKKSDNIQQEWSEKENFEFEKIVNEFYQIYKNLNKY